MALAKLTEQDIRIFLMDKKELNPLLRGVRWSTEDIDAAVNRCIDYYNETPPFINPQTANTFPYKFTLLAGVSGHLLRSASINEASNQLQYSADGVTVLDKDKAEIFAKIGGMFWDEFKEKVTNIKVAQNVAAAFGTNPSELMYVAR
jgi:hypothetical protein